MGPPRRLELRTVVYKTTALPDKLQGQIVNVAGMERVERSLLGLESNLFPELIPIKRVPF
jgi:hypothetical protein